MPYINLIAEQRKQKRDRERKARSWFFAFLGVSVLGLGTVGFLTLKAESASAEARSLQTKLDELRPHKEQIEGNEKVLMSLKPRLETLSKARLDTERWWRILDHASLVIPPETFFTRVKATAGNDLTKPVELAWTGMSVDQNLIGELMLRLQRSPDLAEVALKYTDQKRTPQGTGLEFQIVCFVPGTEESTRAPKKEDTKS